MDKLNSLLSSLRDHAMNGFKNTTSEEHLKRKEICSSCRFWIAKAMLGTGMCLKCGCSSVKLWLPLAKCPIDKW
jgi:hypothetical protein